MAETFRSKLSSFGKDDPGERRSLYCDRRDAGRISIPEARNGSLDQLAAESADALRPLVLSWRGTLEAGRHAPASAGGDQQHRVTHDAAEPVLQTADIASARTARSAPGDHSEARHSGAGRRGGTGAADRGGDSS